MEPTDSRMAAPSGFAAPVKTAWVVRAAVAADEAVVAEAAVTAAIRMAVRRRLRRARAGQPPPVEAGSGSNPRSVKNFVRTSLNTA